MGRGEVKSRVSRGRLHRVHRGVYAVGHRRLGREGRYLAAVLACGPRAVLSYRSAAVWWGLLQYASVQVDVTSPHGRHAVPGVRRHQARSLLAGDITTHNGMPITSVARTLLDLAATAHRHHLERAVAQAERLELYDHRQIEDLLERANGHRGRKPLARATAQEPAFTRSDLESTFLDLTRETSLGEPRTNVVLGAPDHPLLEVDCYWPAHRLVVELDGWRSHGTRAAFRADRRRDAALHARGDRVLRFTWDDVVNEPAMTKRRLEAAAARAA
jgi:hypothetical protein